ncbi:hypothetical protein N665_0025s0079 [Sinapis alba]|nr:hypothetical protein N665_0025s0079 [Sinapis alba]
MQETCQHLFFSCRYSKKIWKDMVGGIMGEDFTAEWTEIIGVISLGRRTSTGQFLICYAFQALAHSLWRERNARRHGEQPKDEKTLSMLVDKLVLMKLLLVQGKDKRYLEDGLQKWLATRA